MYNFGLSSMPTVTDYIKLKYCFGKFTTCPWYKNYRSLKGSKNTDREIAEMLFKDDVVADEIRKSELD
jgi:hypothetical protein